MWPTSDREIPRRRAASVWPPTSSTYCWIGVVFMQHRVQYVPPLSRNARAGLDAVHFVRYGAGTVWHIGDEMNPRLYILFLLAFGGAWLVEWVAALVEVAL
jgi:hypothetical protein